MYHFNQSRITEIINYSTFSINFCIVMTSQYDVIQLHVNSCFSETSSYMLTVDIYFAISIGNIFRYFTRLNFPPIIVKKRQSCAKQMGQIPNNAFFSTDPPSPPCTMLINDQCEQLWVFILRFGPTLNIGLGGRGEQRFIGRLCLKMWKFAVF